MSFKQNHTINTGNYEEYFILYMDNELDGEQKLMVESFIAQHPHLAEELDILMGLKLPADDVSFSGKEELLSGNMRASLVDESLLLYIDNELPAAERKIVEQKLISDIEFSAQHNILLQTKLDASEKILHPNKKELYRNTEKVVVFKVWMRVAAAVIILLLGSLFFLTNRNEKLPDNTLVRNTSPAKNVPAIKPENRLIEQATKKTGPSSQEQILVKTPQQKNARKSITQDVAAGKVDVRQNTNYQSDDVVMNDNNDLPGQREIIKFNVDRFTNEPKIKDPAIVNNTIAYTSVTSSLPKRIIDEGVDEPAVTDGDFKNTKKTPAKGFFRRVSRFIERNTGIGTVNADNELLIGAVALKLK